MLEQPSPREIIEKEYARGWEYYQQGKYADARDSAYILLKTEQDDAQQRAYAILSLAEETPEKCLKYLKLLRQTEPQMASWVGQRLVQIKSDLLGEAGRALAQKDYPQAEHVLELILESAPDDPAAKALLLLAQQSLTSRHEAIENPAATLEQDDNPEYPKTTLAPEAAILVVEEAKFISSSAQTQPSSLRKEVITIAATGAGSTDKESIPAENDAAEAELLSWRLPFASEADIVEAFEGCIQELLARSERLSPQPAELQESLRFARKKKQGTWEESITTNIFLKPAVLAATDLSEALLREAYLHEAFATANVYGELCKVLRARSPQQYLDTFKRLLLVACRALVQMTHKEWQLYTVQRVTPELDNMRQRLQAFCLSPALSTVFDNRTGKFISEVRRHELGESLINEILAEYFAECMQQFIGNEGVIREAFLRRNLSAAAKLLQLAPELRHRLEPWAAR